MELLLMFSLFLRKRVYHEFLSCCTCVISQEELPLVSSFLFIHPIIKAHIVKQFESPKMKTASLILSLSASASAFAPGSNTPRAQVALQETKADLEALASELNPIVKFYDPLNLAEAEFWGCTNEETIGFLRHAEIK